MMIKQFLTTLICLGLYGSTLGLNLCGQWSQYQSSKCIKALTIKATEEEALKTCKKFDSTSSLMTIGNKEEQQFITNLLKSFNNISGSAWLGMKWYEKNGYRWLDGSDSNYTNWADDAVKDGTDPCVEMSLVSPNFGKWTDESCKKSALVVCQRKPVLNLNVLRESFEILEKKLEQQEKKTNNIVPLGFLYTQLPKQSAPHELWPEFNWTDVSTDYSGLFFRAEGNDSASFGQVQQANQSWISNIVDQIFTSQYINGGNQPIQSKIVQPGHWEGNQVLNSQQGIRQVNFFTTQGEVRPKNTAVRIWKRVQ